LEFSLKGAVGYAFRNMDPCHFQLSQQLTAVDSQLQTLAV
jgi:hypothetical protein